MLRFARWLGYRDRALDHLGALLVMYPRGRQFTDDYPGLLGALKAQFEQGASPAGAAVLTAAEIIALLIAQLGPEERGAVLARLGEIDDSALTAAAERRMSRRPEALADRVAFTAGLIGVALLMARRMREENILHREEQNHLLRAAAAALRSSAPDAEGAAEALVHRFAPPEPPSRWSSD